MKGYAWWYVATTPKVPAIGGKAKSGASQVPAVGAKVANGSFSMPVHADSFNRKDHDPPVFLTP